MKVAVIRVLWESDDAEPICEIEVMGKTTNQERRRLLLSLADALIKRYGGADL